MGLSRDRDDGIIFFCNGTSFVVMMLLNDRSLANELLYMNEETINVDLDNVSQSSILINCQACVKCY